MFCEIDCHNLPFETSFYSNFDAIRWICAANNSFFLRMSCVSWRVWKRILISRSNEVAVSLISHLVWNQNLSGSTSFWLSWLHSLKTWLLLPFECIGVRKTFPNKFFLFFLKVCQVLPGLQVYQILKTIWAEIQRPSTEIPECFGHLWHTQKGWP